MGVVRSKLSGKEKLNAKQKKMLEDMEKKEIDFSDIPELSDEELKKFRRANKTRKVTINLNESVIDFFKEQSAITGIPYQTLINLYLTDCEKNNRKPKLSWE